ncbi:J domain-containing protein [Christiangramia sediminis]|uniref:DnaJ domain-containing protein n=1 Tax=Christiangramia sediminis TaxID=2881336 RepID=A0A9X1LJW5_9FLAO|nr:DnaJ domain-containing protein [Christiangramia sediminis]MCB7481617.1 DnaJ domain-containing protein [Christiangramia sediminis]
MADYYKILGVARNASKNDIDRAFYKVKSKFSSEDVEDPYFKNFYRRILEAYNVLSNDKLKTQYDQKFDFSEQKISNGKKEEEKILNEPIIKYFKSNQESLGKGEKLILSWEASFADKIILDPVGKVSPTGTKVIWYDDLAEGETEYNLTAVNENSGRKVSRNIQVKKQFSQETEVLKDSVDIPKEERKEELQDSENVSSVDNKQNSNLIRKYAIPVSIGILFITAGVFFFNKAERDVVEIQSEVVDELSTQEEEIEKSLIALDWKQIQREKQLLAQNLKVSSKSEDRRILEFLDGYRALVNQMNQTFYEDENYEKVSSALYTDQSENKTEASKFFEKLENNGFKISQSEGSPFIEEKSSHLRSVLEPNISDATALGYLDLYLESIDSPCCHDAALMISFDDLINRTYHWGELITKAENSSLADIASRRFANHLYLLFLGIDNTPAFDYDSEMYNNELLKKLERHKLDYPSALSSLEVSNYLKLLESEEYIKNDKVVDYVRGLSGASFDLTSKSYFERFRDPDFRYIPNAEKIIRLSDAENRRDFSKIGSFYAPTVNRYWNDTIVDYTNLKSLYETAWSNSDFSWNHIQNIEEYEGNNLELITKFEYVNKDGDTIYQFSSTHFVFNEDGLIEEVYGVDSDNTYKSLRDSDFDYISDEEKIRRLLKAEDDRDFDKVASYYSSNLKRYWHITEPTFREIGNIYRDAWNTTSYSQNIILNIEKSGFRTYDVQVRFAFYSKNQNQPEAKESFTRYIFNDKGLIEEVYGLIDNQG